MYSQNELLKKLKMEVYKEVEKKYTANDLNDRFILIYSKTSGFTDLMARVRMDGLTEYHFEDYSEYEDMFVDKIVDEIMVLLKKIPSKTIDEYLTEVKVEVFKFLSKKETVDGAKFEARYYETENYKLMEKSVKRRADAEGVIYSDDFEILIAGDVTAIIEELV